MLTPQDHAAREAALDPTQSFIVQAPAGSGKTELLTQRYLALLAQVSRPETILGITFTRKAAGEMRARIIAALQAAQLDTIAAQQLPQTRVLAQAVLQRDQQLQWNLLENPGRLRIQTIDAFCATIARQMPILSRCGTQSTLAENATELYSSAAQTLLKNLEKTSAWTDALVTLLMHCDNDHAKAENLLVAMLARRDQWLPYVAGIRDAAQLRTTLEQSLCNAIRESLVNLQNSIDHDLARELVELARFAAEQLRGINADSSIILYHALSTLPAASVEWLTHWHALAQLLLTASGEWRKKISVNEGFPAQAMGKTAEQKQLFKHMKERLQVLITKLAQDEAALSLWRDLRALPPTHYTDAQWQILTALLTLLPVAVAQLRVIFQQCNTVDYIEIAQSAVAALGEPEAPSELALALDYRLQHILVDEFQDTSIAQFRLLEQLTAGWEVQDGRTLFLVGDPMQSIYRFRKAEVGLFLQARARGLGSVQLHPLVLTVNFRSSAAVVNWINTTFQQLMPKRENISSGAITYTASSTLSADATTAAVTVHPAFDLVSQAQTITELIQATYANNAEAKIAILVRARSHLKTILPALKTADIAYRAVEIETLAERPHIQDALALTRALLHLGDRVAWLAILRAPWCGIALADLHVIAAEQQQLTVWERLQCHTELALSADARPRIQRLLKVLSHSLTQRQRLPLNVWVERTWLALGGSLCWQAVSEQQDLQTYFNLLAQLSSDFFDSNELTRRLQNLYTSPPSSIGNAVEVMTIHKAKGLEFDTVILPNLQATSAADEQQLLLSMERATLFGHADLLLAPIKAASVEHDAIYAYLQHEENKRRDHEILRLLYVAATRAKTALHLTAVVSPPSTEQPISIAEPAANSLLAHVWPALRSAFIERSSLLAIKTVDKDQTTIARVPFTFKRLPRDWSLENFIKYLAQTAQLVNEKVQEHL